MKKKYLLISSIVLFASIIIVAVSFSAKKSFTDAPEVVLDAPAAQQVTSEFQRTKTAIDQLKEKLTINPSDQKSKLLLSLAYIQAARLTGEHPFYYPMALKLSDEVIQENLFKDNALAYEAMVAKSSIQLSLHDFKGALITGKQALSLRSDNAAIYGVLCDANVELGDYNEAVKMSDKMVSIRPDIRSYSRISYLREIFGDRKGSLQAMTMATSAGMPGLEQTEWARTNLGQLYEKSGDLINAEIHYKTALQHSPNYSFAMAGLARVEAKKKNFDKALVLLNNAAQQIPEFSFHEQIAELYRYTNKKEEGIKKAKEVLVMLQEDADAGHNSDLEFAILYATLLDNYDEGLRFAMKEYARRPLNIDVCKALAYIYYKKNDFRSASLFMSKALRTNKQEADLLCLSGMINYKNGQKEDGLKRIKKGLAMDPYSYSSVMLEAKSYLTEGTI